MYKLSFEKRVWIVKQLLRGKSPLRVALAQNVHRSLVYQLKEKYEVYGWDGLKDHKTGRPESGLNRNAEIIILDIRRRFGYGACRIPTGHDLFFSPFTPSFQRSTLQRAKRATTHVVCRRGHSPSWTCSSCSCPRLDPLGQRKHAFSTLITFSEDLFLFCLPARVVDRR